MGRERETELPLSIVPRGLLTFALQWNLDKRTSRCGVLAVTNGILRPSNSTIYEKKIRYNEPSHKFSSPLYNAFGISIRASVAESEISASLFYSTNKKLILTVFTLRLSITDEALT